MITGAGCTVPPNGAAFYPWFHLITANGGCAWTLSNDIPGQLDSFGGVQAAWGPLELTDFGGGFRRSTTTRARSSPTPARERPVVRAAGQATGAGSRLRTRVSSYPSNLAQPGIPASVAALIRSALVCMPSV